MEKKEKKRPKFFRREEEKGEGRFRLRPEDSLNLPPIPVPARLWWNEYGDESPDYETGFIYEKRKEKK